MSRGFVPKRNAGAGALLTEEDLERELSTPSKELTEFMKNVDGDFLVLGAGGKMGPSLSLMLQRGVEKTRGKKRIIAVSKFSTEGIREKLQSAGIKTIVADLSDEEQLARLPKAENVIDMAAQKFGTTGGEYSSWALNTYLPGRIAEKFRESRIVHFSTGNVYPFASTKTRGSRVGDTPSPLGEYAQSRLGGERIMEYFSRMYGTRVTTLRLNYAVELRYGVLHDIARSVMDGRQVDLRMGHVNVIWQRDANDIAARSLAVASTPPRVLNLTGPEKISVRRLAKQFGELFGKEPKFRNAEEETALLSDASATFNLFGLPVVKLDQMIVWVAEWLKAEGRSLYKPTHFQERTGRF